MLANGERVMGANRARASDPNFSFPLIGKLLVNLLSPMPRE